MGTDGGTGIFDFAAVYCQTIVFVGYGLRLHRDNPAGMDEGVDYHQYSCVVGLVFLLTIAEQLLANCLAHYKAITVN